jgi:tetratricopeptide (TPR) repeat protein
MAVATLDSTRTSPLASVGQPEADARLTPARLARENARHDRILTALLVVFVALLTSFPVINADTWMYLRTGQMILDGSYTFGVDPFCYTTEGLYWTNTGWLSDAVLYAVYSWGGGVGLSILRALIALATLLFLGGIGRRGGSRFVTVCMLGLAMIVLSHRLLMRTELWSFLFLSATLYILWRPASHAPRSGLKAKLLGRHGRLWWLLVPLFLLWANLDAWFILGPVCVAAVLAGEWMQSALSIAPVRLERPDEKERSMLLLVLVCGVVATFANPHTYHVWRLPGELSSVALGTLKEYQPNLLIDLSPFDFSVYLNRRADPRTSWYRPAGVTVAEWAYYPLVLLSAVSFLLNRRKIVWARLLLWILFFGLSAWQARNAGLFAVVAGPIAVLNIQDWLRARFGEEPSLTRGWVAAGQLGRVAALFVLVVLIGLMFYRPGESGTDVVERETRQGLVHQRGYLGWSLFVNESLRQSAETMHEWRSANRLPGRAYRLHWNEGPAYASFFDPGGQSFMDTRFGLHSAATVDDQYRLLQTLEATRPDGAGAARDATLKTLFGKYGITHIIVNAQAPVTRIDSRTRLPVQVPLVELLLDDRDASGKSKWEQLDYTDGRTVILAWTLWEGWRDEHAPHWTTLQRLKYAPDREAFRAPKRLPPAGGRAEARMVSSTAAWLSGDVYRRPLALDEMIWHKAQAARAYDSLLGQTIQATSRYLTVPLGATLVGVPAPPLPWMSEGLTGAAPILAVRAGRRALADNPRHADVHFELYRAYVSLQRQEEMVAEARNPPREVQMVAALRQSALLNPMEYQRQRELARWYFNHNVADLFMAHVQLAHEAFRRLLVEEGLVAQVLQEAGPEELDAKITQIISREIGLPLDRLEPRFRSLRDNYTASAARQRDPIENAQQAIQLGLLDHARTELERAVALMPVDTAFTMRNNQAFRQLLEVYLNLGFSTEAILIFTRPDAAARLGEAAWYNFGSLVAAADGNYEQALRYRDRLDSLTRQAAINDLLEGTAAQTLGGQGEPFGSIFYGMGSVIDGFDKQRQRADVLCISGLLALEAGLTERAAEYFRRSIEDTHGNNTYRPLAARYYRQLTGKWLENRATTSK